MTLSCLLLADIAACRKTNSSFGKMNEWMAAPTHQSPRPAARHARPRSQSRVSAGDLGRLPPTAWLRANLCRLQAVGLARPAWDAQVAAATTTAATWTWDVGAQRLGTQWGKCCLLRRAGLCLVLWSSAKQQPTRQRPNYSTPRPGLLLLLLLLLHSSSWRRAPLLIIHGAKSRRAPRVCRADCAPWLSECGCAGHGPRHSQPAARPRQRTLVSRSRHTLHQTARTTKRVTLGVTALLALDKHPTSRCSLAVALFVRLAAGQ